MDVEGRDRKWQHHQLVHPPYISGWKCKASVEVGGFGWGGGSRSRYLKLLANCTLGGTDGGRQLVGDGDGGSRGTHNCKLAGRLRGRAIILEMPDDECVRLR